MGNGGHVLHSVNFTFCCCCCCWMENKMLDKPLCLIPGQMYLAAYLRRGLKSHIMDNPFKLVFSRKCRIIVQLATFYINCDWRCAINCCSVKPFPWETNLAMLSDEVNLYPLRQRYLLSAFCTPCMDLWAHIFTTTVLDWFWSACFKRWGNPSSERGSSLPPNHLAS